MALRKAAISKAVLLFLNFLSFIKRKNRVETCREGVEKAYEGAEQSSGLTFRSIEVSPVRASSRRCGRGQKPRGGSCA